MAGADHDPAAAYTLRLATASDQRAVDDLLQRSYPVLLQADYSAQVMQTVVPLIARARPELLTSGRYFLLLQGETAVGAGGYSLAAPGPRDGPAGAVEPGLAHIRHVATDPARTRQGIGRRLMTAVLMAARAEGASRFECLSTLTAVPFYAAMGFVAQEQITLPLGPQMAFPAVRMVL